MEDYTMTAKPWDILSFISCTTEWRKTKFIYQCFHDYVTFFFFFLPELDIDEHSCIDCYLCIHSYVYYTSQILCFDVYNRCTKMSHVYCPDTFTSALLMEGISAALVCLQFTCCHITCVLYAGCIYFETMYTNCYGKATAHNCTTFYPSTWFGHHLPFFNCNRKAVRYSTWC